MLFARTDEIDASWKVVTPILTYWKDNPNSLMSYEPGSDGPAEAELMIEKEGRKWYFHTK
jgi:glucose-6-phosphate 1-dehydrogenase